MTYIPKTFTNWSSPYLDADYFNGIEQALADDGWHELTLTSSFQKADTSRSHFPEYRKVGKMVELRGYIKPTASGTGSSSSIKIADLPTGYRPNSIVSAICGTGGLNKWQMLIESSGRVSFMNYGTSSYASYTTSSILTFDVMFFAD